MDIVARWTGRHGLALAEAMRLPREVFARQLGISPRTMADWARQPRMPLALKTQELLDIVLDRESDAVRRRFADLLEPPYWPEVPAPALSPDTAAALVTQATGYQDDASSAVSLLTDLASAEATAHIGAAGTRWVKTAGPGVIAGYLFGGVSASDANATGTDRATAAERVRIVAHNLMDLDFQLGGGVVRRMLSTFFDAEVAPLLRRQHPPGARREIFDAAAEVAQLLGWSAYDAGAHGLAQAYYTQGLRLAAEADDRRLAAYLLGDLSHQANYLGNFEDALQLARAAQSALSGSGTATQTTAALAMEARALASLGSRRECVAVLSRAEATFERSNPADDPPWMSYFTAEELAGERLHCFASLAMPSDAQTAAAQAIGTDTPARTRVLINLVAAQSAVIAGDLDEGIGLARGALDGAGAVASVRCKHYVSDFRKLISAAHPKAPGVKSFIADLRQDHPALARAS
jgi:hypothetical protein